MRVQEGSRVKLSFICRLEDGTLYDFTDRDQLEFIVGQGNTLPTLEMGVLGMKEGEQRSIKVPTAELDEFPYVQDEAPTEPGFPAGTAGGGYEFGPGEEGDIVPVDHEPGAGGLQNLLVPPYVVEVAMGVDDCADGEAQCPDPGKNPVGIGAGIHHHPFSGLLAAEDEAIDPQGADDNGFEYHSVSPDTDYWLNRSRFFP